jgi:hypothetical protein
MFWLVPHVMLKPLRQIVSPWLKRLPSAMQAQLGSCSEIVELLSAIAASGSSNTKKTNAKRKRSGMMQNSPIKANRSSLPPKEGKLNAKLKAR